MKACLMYRCDDVLFIYVQMSYVINKFYLGSNQTKSNWFIEYCHSHPVSDWLA